MKKTFLAALLATAVTGNATLAASLEPPVMPPVVMIEEAEASSSGIWIPLALFAVMAAALLQGSGGQAASDARFKTDVTQVGTTEGGLPLYHFRYTGLPTVFEGVMAQDVLMQRPDAIVPLPFGFMAVDYGKLGLRMRIVG